MGLGVVKLFKILRKARRCYFIWICRDEYEEELFVSVLIEMKRDGCMLAEELGLYVVGSYWDILKRSFRLLES
jgi:hypothetical protein